MAKKSKTTTVVAPNHTVTHVEPILVKTPAEMRLTKIPRRRVRQHYFRYTVDELLSLMVVCGDNQVLLYDNCDMSEYRYHKISLEKDAVKVHVESEQQLHKIFESFTLDPDVFMEYEDQYWESLAPGSKLLSSIIAESDDDNAAGYEYPQTRLNPTAAGSYVPMDVLPLVHALPVDAVHKWLKFVGRKFSDIPQDTENKHIPFNTIVMW